MPRRLSCVGVLAAAVMAATVVPIRPAHARLATIDVSVTGGVIDIKVVPGQTLAVTIVDAKTKLSVASGSTDPNTGLFSQTVNVAATDEYTIGIGGETYTVKPGVHQDLLSDEEAKKKPPLLPPKAPGPIKGSFSFDFDSIDGLPTNQFSLQNSSADLYEFTALRLYQDLDLGFFTTSAFDSAAALASGLLNRDVVAALGPVTLLPGGSLQFSEGPVLPGHYQLLLGSVQIVLPGGSLGPADEVAIANAVPEPPGVLLLAAALLAAGFSRWGARRGA